MLRAMVSLSVWLEFRYFTGRPYALASAKEASFRRSVTSATWSPKFLSNTWLNDQVFAARLADADEFYERITPKNLSEDECRVHRQALAGMLWTKQYYYFDLDKWLSEHESHP